ncbi:MAG: hypothetical protein RL497_1810 [Pseudomonadota bacterium]|jgi:hypothetical protein
MKPASRFMPKCPAKIANKLVLFFVTVLLTAILILQPMLFAFLAAATLLIGTMVHFENIKTKRYFDTLFEERKHLSIGQFAQEFDARTIDTRIIRAVYEEIQAILPTQHKIPIKASDNLLNIFKLDADDLDLDLAPAIAHRTGRSFENNKNNPLYGKVVTVRDLVLFFNYQAQLG